MHVLLKYRLITIRFIDILISTIYGHSRRLISCILMYLQVESRCIVDIIRQIKQFSLCFSSSYAVGFVTTGN